MARESQLLRYVVLRHEGIPQPHFDLMCEHKPGSKLLCWRFPVWPVTKATKVEELRLHRREYLDYEGPVSGDRGHVRRVEAGACLVTCSGDNVWLLTMVNYPARPTLMIWPRDSERVAIWMGDKMEISDASADPNRPRSPEGFGP